MADRNRSRFIRGAVRSERRKTLWLAVPHTLQILGASGTAVLTLSLNAAALALRPFTVVRTRLKWLVESDQVAASENYVGNIGCAVVSDQAVGIGVTAVPTPATDLSSDKWFMIDQWEGSITFASGTGVRENWGNKTLDSKAMRKVDQGEDLVLVVEAGLGGSGCAIQVSGRQLIKLH